MGYFDLFCWSPSCVGVAGPKWPLLVTPSASAVGLWGATVWHNIHCMCLQYAFNGCRYDSTIYLHIDDDQKFCVFQPSADQATSLSPNGRATSQTAQWHCCYEPRLGRPAQDICKLGLHFCSTWTLQIHQSCGGFFQKVNQKTFLIGGFPHDWWILGVHQSTLPKILPKERILQRMLLAARRNDAHFLRPIVDRLGAPGTCGWKISWISWQVVNIPHHPTITIGYRWLLGCQPSKVVQDFAIHSITRLQESW